MTDWSPDGSENGKKEGELYLSQIIELAQHHGVRFVHTANSWQLFEDRERVTLYHTKSWVTLSDAALHYCLFHNIPLTVAELEMSRAAAKAAYDHEFPDSAFLRKKYEA